MTDPAGINTLIARVDELERRLDEAEDLDGLDGLHCGARPQRTHSGWPECVRCGNRLYWTVAA